MTIDIDTSRPVLVTGATGYVAGRLVERLLAEGLTVHAAVRDPGRKEKLAHLDEAAARLPGTIRYFAADLMQPGSYTEAMAGCQVVFHTASPFVLGVNDPQKDLVDPAVNGTRSVLESANAVESVQRVVLTSSCAAIYGDNVELNDVPGGIFTEEHWNTTSSLDHNPYPYSKVMAEKAAWEIAEAQSRWDLVVINPSFVIGPGLSPFGTSESFKVVQQMGNGMMLAGAPKLGMGAVDVRDLAEAHFRAGFTPGASGRYIASGHNTDFVEMAQTLRPRFDKYPLPKGPLPKWLMKLIGPITNKGVTRRYVELNVNHPLRVDNAKSRRELGMDYRPLAESMNDFFQQLIDSGQLKAR